MFSRPNSTDSKYLLADYAEYKCFADGGSISSGSLRFLISASDDEIDNDGVESSDDRSIDLLNEAMDECSDRIEKCNGHYPFVTDGGSLELNSSVPSEMAEIYLFLLLATRLNMSTQRVHAGEDATQLFERLCALVAKEYYGSHSKSMVFGTGNPGGFKDKVNDLLRTLYIDATYKPPLGTTGRMKDGNLDVVVWIPFSDNKDGQFIAMGQCKTGDHWEGMLSELNPSDFFGNYTTNSPFVPVTRLFFVTESFGIYKWEERSRQGGILFDRTRIMEYLPNDIEPSLLASIASWNRAAISTIKDDVD